MEESPLPLPFSDLLAVLARTLDNLLMELIQETKPIHGRDGLLELIVLVIPDAARNRTGDTEEERVFLESIVHQFNTHVQEILLNVVRDDNVALRRVIRSCIETAKILVRQIEFRRKQ